MRSCKQKWQQRLGGFAVGLYCVAAFGTHAVFAASDDHGSSADHGSAGLPQFDPSSYPSQIFWLTVSFAILYIFFSSKTLPDISSVLENRREHIESDMDTAERLKEEAKETQESYETALNESRAKAAAARMQASDKIKAKTETEMQALREKSEQEIAALETRLTKTRQDAMDDMDSIAAEIASIAAEKIVGIKTDIDKAKSLVQSLNRREAA